MSKRKNKEMNSNIYILELCMWERWLVIVVLIIVTNHNNQFNTLYTHIQTYIFFAPCIFYWSRWSIIFYFAWLHITICMYNRMCMNDTMGWNNRRASQKWFLSYSTHTMLVVSIWQSFIELCEEKEIDNVFVNTPITTLFFRN